MTIARFFGYLFCIAGILLAVTAGGCGLLFVAIGLTDSSSDDYGIVPLALIIGGAFCLIGLGIAWLGRTILRANPAVNAGTIPPAQND
jgi:peptidoglycan/LPS O-acetylase OafA/YrhL